MHEISRGVDIPISGEPRQQIEDGPVVSRVALVGPDYVGMKPTMEVKEGDRVRLGQVLFSDKKTEGVRYMSPGCGRVAAVNRGAKRVFESVVIELDGDDEEEFTSYENDDLTRLSREQVRDNLVDSGLWTALRTRPYSKVPPISSSPHSIFVTAIDTRPLAVRPELVVSERENDFRYGLQVLKQLTDGPVYLCKAEGAEIPGTDVEGVTVEEFSGPHPAGLPGTHIHLLDPVSERKSVWSINYQDVIAFGRLFVTGRLPVDRVVSLAGPMVENPRLLRTRIGAHIGALITGELKDGNVRVISGSVLSGRKAEGTFEYLGRYDLQVSAIKEDSERVFMGWQDPGFSKFSVKRIFASAWFGGDKKFDMTTTTHGSKRAMVPIGMYERVMPMDVLPTFLLRSLIIGDVEQARDLGALEMDEEDLSLCTFVCPSKYEYGPLLRKTLTQIEREG